MIFKDILAILLIILSSDQLIGCEDPLGSDVTELSDDLDSDLRVCSLESNCLNDKSTLDAINYLKTYGYIHEERSVNEITTIELSNALIHLQEFAGIERTGRLDENVIEVMKMKRCNEPDFKTHHTNAKRREKRSALGAYKWVPYEADLPELPLNWEATIKHPSHEIHIKPYIERFVYTAQIWMNVANVTLRQIFAKEDSIYHQIILDLYTLNPNDTDFYRITAQNRTATLHSDTKLYYKGFDIAINPFKVITTGMVVHILGHVLGLEHTKDINSIMSPFYDNKTEPYLDRQDIIDIQTLYGPNPNTPESDILYGLNPKSADRDKTAPNLCLDSKIDSALEQSDGVWLLFKGKHYIRIGPRGQTPNSPRKIVWDFKNFTSNPIDASLSWNEIVFLFSGNEFWKYRNRKFITTRKISEAFVGIPDGPFDDVFRWNVNQKTYFFRGGQYWKYDSEKGKVSDGYPKKISEHWKGIPDSFDAAISSRTRNQTYFFKDTKYYRFDDINKKVVDKVFPPYPRETEIWFAKCRNTKNVPEKPLLFRLFPTYEDVPDPNEIETFDDNSYWEGVLQIILILSFIVIIICGALSLYLYVFVLRPGEQQPQQLQMTEQRPAAQPTVPTQRTSEENEIETAQPKPQRITSKTTDVGPSRKDPTSASGERLTKRTPKPDTGEGRSRKTPPSKIEADPSGKTRRSSSGEGLTKRTPKSAAGEDLSRPTHRSKTDADPSGKTPRTASSEGPSKRTPKPGTGEGPSKKTPPSKTEADPSGKTPRSASGEGLSKRTPKSATVEGPSRKTPPSKTGAGTSQKPRDPKSMEPSK